MWLCKYLFYQVRLVFDFFSFLELHESPGYSYHALLLFTDTSLQVASDGCIRMGIWLTQIHSFPHCDHCVFWVFPSLERELLLHYCPMWSLRSSCNVSLLFLCFNEVLLESPALPLLSLLSGLFPVYFPLKCYSATSSLLGSCSAVVEEKTF